MDALKDFAELWAVDFEFGGPEGASPTPVCMVARELRSRRTIRLWQDELATCHQCPFDTSASSLIVAYFATAELTCFGALGWSMPARVLDLYVEFRNATNGLVLPLGRSLLGALAFHGLGGMAADRKEEMQQLALRVGSWSDSEQQALLDYCESDVDALEVLLPRMAPGLDVERALLRGRYMAAIASVEARGVPVDVATWRMLRENWSTVQSRVVARLGGETGIYEGSTFKRANFAEWCGRQQIAWPVLRSGLLALDDDTFKEQERLHPAVGPVRDLRRILAQMRAPDLAIGKDGRNRVMLSPFSSKTGRNQPSTSRFVLGCPAWFRELVQPAPGRALAYIDWEQQEFGIAAALSGDENMQAACASGDPYLAFAKQANAVPLDATKVSHPAQREVFKLCALGVLFGMSDAGLARRIGQPVEAARQLLRLHRRTFPDFWEWQEAILDHARLRGCLHTVFGWRLAVGPTTGDRTIRNFPMQANGAEMLRVACCLAIEGGIDVCAPLHDALIIEADEQDIERAAYATRLHMAEASAAVLDGFRLRTDTKIFRYPERFSDPRGTRMWKLVREELDQVALAPTEPLGGQRCHSTSALVPTRSISYEDLGDDRC